ncbi:hypothetical protein M3O40_15265 [Xanthomonas nasturtii]|uniref:hypothetical protein n=1 Tax=Xanthomonas nasturtii TaxID=1843581 RepID=UPI002013B51B|nr:hypothetical protein [Xanthomonas nasturtii]MCL1500690.1 hypothetical protein [Xanthomonas nasturtii]MCL1504447.1 hypothetical protein [Xanthomonas nasturtii]
MRQVLDTVWQRRGTSWLWDEEARNTVCEAGEVWSLRQFLQAAVPSAQGWPEDLPSNRGQTLVVAGLEGSLDLLAPDQSENWLGDTIKRAILSFQDEYAGEAALIFWLPQGQSRLRVQASTDAVNWLCEAPHRGQQLDFGRLLWGEANEYPQEILLREGATAAGLFHLRIT